MKGSLYACGYCSVVHHFPFRHPDDVEENCGACKSYAGWSHVG